MKRAREMGRQRTAFAIGEDEVREREEKWKDMFSKERALKDMEFILRGPFEDKSEL